MEFIERFYRQIGEIIRTERELADLTQDELAVQVGLTRSSITNIEKGRQRIQLHTLYAIADELNVPASDLLPLVETTDQASIDKLLPKGLLREERDWVKSVLGVKGKASKPGGGKAIEMKLGITPSELLQAAKVSKPPVPVEQIAQYSGVRVRLVPFKGKIAGLAFRGEDNIIIGVNSTHPKGKRRFTIAHELGHLALHSPSVIYLDRHTTAYRIDKDSVKYNALESEANEFAIELLMPRRMLENDLKETLADYDDHDLVSSLADRYEVSYGVMSARLVTLVTHSR